MRAMKKMIAVLAAIIICAVVYSQTPETILDSVRSGRRPEKIFTQFDRRAYTPGETIWFKTYITIDGRPGTYSSVAKAELINEDGKIIHAQVLPVMAGTVHGALLLPANISYGNYTFRLYTQQMLRTGGEHYYKSIPILPSSADLNTTAGVTEIAIRFFTEGGDFLAGEFNTIAFRATDQAGRPVDISGVIKDWQGVEVMPFKTEYNGMGKLEITPKKGEQYTAHYALPSGATRSIALPDVREEGINLVVLDEVLRKRLMVTATGAHAQKPSYILGEMDQTVVFKIDVSKSNGRFMGRVPMKDLPGGLLHIAVFSADHNVLAERTCFVTSRRDTAEALLQAIATSLAKRGENNFNFLLDGLEGTFSMAVTDIAGTATPAMIDNIISATLITANLEAAENPFYTIGQITGDTKNDAVDLLLLTHAYKWDWKQLKKMAAGPSAASAQPYITLRGKALADKNNKPLPDAELSFIIETSDSAVNFFTAQTDAAGNFEIPGLLFEDTAKIYVKNNANKNKDKKVDLEITSPALAAQYALPVQKNKLPAVFIAPELKTKPVVISSPALDIDTSGIVLGEIVVESKAKSPTELLEKRYAKGMFSGSARATIDFVNEKPTYLGGNIFEYLRGRYSYMQVKGNFPNFYLVYRAMRSLMGGDIPMAIYLDEMQADANILTTVPMGDIAMVRIYGPGFLGPAGALAVYTKRGEDGGGEPRTFLTNFTVAGFSKVNPFYSPDYKKLDGAAVKSDKRKTLYWNPSLIFIPEDEKIPVTFFNSDQCKEYRIIIQGFTMEGRLVYFEKIIRE
jgi:hypothetical protein